MSKGLFTKKSLGTITRNMVAEIRNSGGDIAGVYYCIHRSEDNCSCRKPKIGLFKRALRDFLNKNGTRYTVHGTRNIVNNTYFIGDDRRDVEAGRKFGCKTVLVLTGKTKRRDVRNFKTKPDLIADDILEAVNKILK